jgi:hypothetical protein
MRKRTKDKDGKETVTEENSKDSANEKHGNKVKVNCM